MPKGGRKGDKKNNRDIIADVKLSDFANCSARTSRLRKSVGNFLCTEVAQDTCDALWYERDLEEFNFTKPSNSSRKSLEHEILQDETNSGILYPIDVWYLIGQFVKPEDVKAFAAICKDSYFVSRTYSFWLKMYKRYYRPDVHLPERLQPECIEGSLCLKMYVVRALYHMYPLFISQISSHMLCPNTYSLSNLFCASMWHIQQNGKWWFYFKFQTKEATTSSRLNVRVAIQNLWTKDRNEEMYVNHNPEEGCKILRVLSSHFVIVSPFIMGSRLSDVQVHLAHDMRRQKLQLTFCYSSYKQRGNGTYQEAGAYGNVIVFDPVENISILNWWHPQYPADFKI